MGDDTCDDQRPYRMMGAHTGPMKESYGYPNAYSSSSSRMMMMAPPQESKMMERREVGARPAMRDYGMMPRAKLMSDSMDANPRRIPHPSGQDQKLE